MPMYFQKFTVEGSGRFPFDMLRYDACWPYEEYKDSGKLGGDYAEPVRQVTLARLVERKDVQPTVGRWNSFDWRVVPGSVVTKKR